MNRLRAGARRVEGGRVGDIISRPGWAARTLAIFVAVALALATPAAANAAGSAPAEHGRFHHVHLNVSDIARTTAFYQKVFGVTPVRYNGRQPALMAERAFIFLTEVPAPIPSQLQTGVIHIGWSGVDGKSEYAWWKKEGIEFYTPLTPLLSGDYMYLYGPDREVIEIWSIERHHRFNHIHMLAADPKATAEWFARVVNSAAPAVRGPEGLGNYNVSFGDVTLHIFPDIAPFKPKERLGAILPTDKSGIDHLGFSFRDLAAAYRRVKASGAAIVSPMGADPASGLRRFFVRAPNGVLVELVKARPLPDAAWE